MSSKKKIFIVIGIIVIIVVSFVIGLLIGQKNAPKPDLATTKTAIGQTFYAKIESIKQYNDGSFHLNVTGLEVNDINYRGNFTFKVDDNMDMTWRGEKITVSDLKEGNIISITFTDETVVDISPTPLSEVIKIQLLDDEIIEQKSETGNLEGNNESNERIVMVNNKLYYDTKTEDTTTGRCGTMDGNISSHVSSNEVPKINNQSNFEGNYGYQYGSKKTIEVCIDEKWVIFEAKTYTRTYTLEHIKHGQEEDSYYLTLSKFQGETETVLVKDIDEKLEVGKFYEFVFTKKNSLQDIEDNIESIFENSDIVEIKETDKIGLDQIQEPI